MTLIIIPRFRAVESSGKSFHGVVGRIAAQLLPLLLMDANGASASSPRRS